MDGVNSSYVTGSESHVTCMIALGLSLITLIIAIVAIALIIRSML